MRYYPKRPVKSFQDLQVYQKTHGLAIEIAKRVTAEVAPEIEETSNKSQVTVAEVDSKSQKGQNVRRQENIGTGTADVAHKITKNLIETVLRIPKLIATAHSLRFGDSKQAITTLEETMLSCNLAVVYLEQFRDLVNQKIETDYFEEQIKEYLRVRGKIMRLQRAWKKFMEKRT